MSVAKKTLQLNTLMIQQDFFENAALLGISSDSQMYALCGLLNHRFNIDFIRTPIFDVQMGVKGKKTEPYTFPVYQYYIANSALYHTLYKLKSKEIYLLPDIRNIEYIWMIRGNDVIEAEAQAQNYLIQLQTFPEVQFVSLLEIERIRNIDYLVL